jgi:hypothetical protein
MWRKSIRTARSRVIDPKILSESCSEAKYRHRKSKKEQEARLRFDPKTNEQREDGVKISCVTFFPSEFVAQAYAREKKFSRAQENFLKFS